MQEKQDILLKDVILYTKKPFYQDKTDDLNFFSKIKNIIKLISWSYIISFAIGIAISYALDMAKYGGTHEVETFATNSGVIATLLTSVLIIPLIEETTFRLLLKFRPIFVALSICFFVFFFGDLVLTFFHIQSSDRIVLVTGPVVGLILFLTLRIKSISNNVLILYKNHFPVIFFSLIIIFGLLHIFNYSDLHKIWFLIPILGLSQIIAGLVLSYVRIKYGFWYGYLTHALYNFFLILPLAFSTLIKDESLLGLLAIPIIVIMIYGVVTLIQEAIKIKKIRAKIA